MTNEFTRTDADIDRHNADMLQRVRPELAKAVEHILLAVRNRGHRMIVANVKPVVKMFDGSPNEDRNERFKEGEAVQFSFVNAKGQTSWSVNDRTDLIREYAADLLSLEWGGSDPSDPDPYFVSMPTPGWEMPDIAQLAANRARHRFGALPWFQRIGLKITGQLGLFEISIAAVVVCAAVIVISELKEWLQR